MRARVRKIESEGERGELRRGENSLAGIIFSKRQLHLLFIVRVLI